MKNKNIIISLALVLVAALGIGFYFFKSSDSEVALVEMPVTRGDLVLSVQASATVSPQNRLEIKPPIAGRIDEVLIKEGQEVKKGTILAWISSTERAALLDSVRTQGAAEIKKWENLYRATPVMAPIDGTIILRSVEAGQSFTNADSIFTMADRLTVKAQVDETDIAQIKVGQKTKITLDAYSRNPFQGEVVHVAYDATVLNNVTTYEVDILPDEVPDYMRSGMTANVDVEIQRKENIILLPITSLVTTQEGSEVRLKSSKGYSLVKVETGQDDGKMIEIVAGLNENDVILIEDKTAAIGKKTGSSSPFMPQRSRRK